MTTSQLIKKITDLAKIGIVNAKEDAEVLLEAAARLIELRAKACPKWNWGLIMDDGMFLESIDGDETNWTACKEYAIQFSPEEMENGFAEHFLDGLGEGELVLYDDYEGYGVKFEFKDMRMEGGDNESNDAGECDREGVRLVPAAEDHHHEGIQGR